MKIIPLRNIVVSIFVVIWTLLFHYESTRFFYLNPLFRTKFPDGVTVFSQQIRELPHMKFLFPPAGWIMFFNVDDQFGYAEVYGLKGKDIQLIDPHQILRTRAIGYDNIHRNVLGEILDTRHQKDFCRFLRMRFPDFDNFLITAVHYPSVVKTPYQRLQRIVYECRY